MSARVEAGTKALWVRNHDMPFESAAEGFKAPYRREATVVLEATDAPILALIEEAENRLGAMRCMVTTYELRKALGRDVTDWPTR